MLVGFGCVYCFIVILFNLVVVDMDMMVGEGIVCNRIDSKGLRKIRWVWLGILGCVEWRMKG